MPHSKPLYSDLPVDGFAAVEAERRDGVRHLLRGQLLIGGGGAVLRRPLERPDERDDGAGVAQGRPGFVFNMKICGIKNYSSPCLKLLHR